MHVFNTKMCNYSVKLCYRPDFYLKKCMVECPPKTFDTKLNCIFTTYGPCCHSGRRFTILTPDVLLSNNLLMFILYTLKLFKHV